jgi:hypothetical protein
MTSIRLRINIVKNIGAMMMKKIGMTSETNIELVSKAAVMRRRRLERSRIGRKFIWSRI